MSLEKCFRETNNNTDKFNLGYISEFYEPLFSNIQTTVKKVLEIGIYQGESIRLWKDYFLNADIYCTDINRCPRIENIDRIKPIYGNAYDLNFVSNFEKNSFDVVIDDGPHTYESMQFFLSNYLDLVKKGGYCILEDIIDRSWTPSLIDIIKHRTDIKFTVYDMRLKQKTQNLLEDWKNGLDVIVIEKIN